ncbi:MAG: adenine phosphoribosyltransferase [Clostridia bacterium]|nr:adenine phosphoribosyltransferase [Clostridia bacterium]
MGMTYPMHVAGLTRDLPLCKVNDDLYIGAFVIFGDVELTVACARELLKKAPEYDVLITAESKGIPLAYEMARQAGTNRYLLARKSPKLYMRNVFTVKVNSITTAKEQILCIDQDDVDFMQGKRVLIVDDVISTGESLHAVEELVKQAGGNIVGRMAILAEGDATERDDIIYLEKLPLFNADGTVKE